MTAIEQINNMSAAQIEELLNQKRAKEAEEKEAERKQYEYLKDQTVTSLTIEASALMNSLKNFKARAFQEAGALYELLCQYSKRHADGKGNFSVESADGSMRMTVNQKDLNRFDERSIQAEKHIKEFITKRFSGDDDTTDLILSILERKRGTLDIRLIQKLYAMENRFTDPSWIEGIKLLKESWNPTETKGYITFEVRIENEWKAINLNFASI